MVTVEELSIVIPILVGVVVPVVMFFMMRHVGVLDKTASRSTLATFNIGMMKDEVKEVKDTITDNRMHFDKRVDALMQSLDKREDAHKEEFRRTWEKIDLLNSSMKLAEYRLDRIDRRNGAVSG